jgi:hypothetical protein
MLMRAGLGWLVLEVMGFGTVEMYEGLTTSPYLHSITARGEEPPQ